MPLYDPQVPWTDEQWARVNAVIQEEAARARVAATFLPLVGPLSPDADFVRLETVNPVPGAAAPAFALTLDDTDTRRLACLQVRVQLRGAQMQDPELTSALSLFRRAANILARLEDGIVLEGLRAPGLGLPPALPAGVVPPGVTAALPPAWQITSAVPNDGLYEAATGANPLVRVNPGPPGAPLPGAGQRLVVGASQAISQLEARGQFGPYALVLGNGLFLVAQTPDPNSLVLPQDRIIPFLGGGSLLRSSALRPDGGVMVALGGSAIELVVATDISLQFLQVTVEPAFVFRVFEKIEVRIKDRGAITALVP
jgi:uncharacterized linocin/CFP29 family protein